MTQRVLHADFIAIAPDKRAERARLIDAASRLTELAQVVDARTLEADEGGDFDLALVFLLPDLAALEAFGTDQRYSRFLQADVAPLLRGFAGADVSVEDDLPDTAVRAACMALAAPDQTYDWEVSAALDAWASASGGAAVCGVAAGERGLFRGLALVAGDDVAAAPPPGGRFGPTIITGTLRRLP